MMASSPPSLASVSDLLALLDRIKDPASVRKALQEMETLLVQVKEGLEISAERIAKAESIEGLVGQLEAQAKTSRESADAELVAARALKEKLESELGVAQKGKEEAESLKADAEKYFAEKRAVAEAMHADAEKLMKSAEIKLQEAEALRIAFDAKVSKLKEVVG